MLASLLPPPWRLRDVLAMCHAAGGTHAYACARQQGARARWCAYVLRCMAVPASTDRCQFLFAPACGPACACALTSPFLPLSPPLPLSLLSLFLSLCPSAELMDGFVYMGRQLRVRPATHPGTGPVPLYGPGATDPRHQTHIPAGA